MDTPVFKDLITFEKIGADIKAFVEPAKNVVVNTDAQKELALSSVKQLQAFKKIVDARRDELVRPLNDRVKLINAFAKKLLEPVNEVDAHIRNQLVAWERELEAMRSKARRAEQERVELEKATLEQEARTAEIFNAPPPRDTELAIFEAEAESVKSLKFIEAQRVKGTTKTWKFVVEGAASVPREFCMPDEAKIRDAVKRGVREIPGCRIFEDITITVRS